MKDVIPRNAVASTDGSFELSWFITALWANARLAGVTAIGFFGGPPSSTGSTTARVCLRDDNVLSRQWNGREYNDDR